MLTQTRADQSRATGEEILDVIGVGFGPSNLAITIALDEYNQSAPAEFGLRAVFFERHPELRWHPGMLFDDASMQISFLKDLTTFRNPQSPYTFINFLKGAERLVDFTNRGSMEPLRVEFVAYLRWVAEQLASYVRYSSSVTAVTPVFRTDAAAERPTIDHFEVTIDGPDGTETAKGRNVVISAGLQPRLPDGVEAGERVWHSAEFLPRIARFAEESAKPAGQSFAVFGSGQSSAEVALHLYERFPDATVHLISSRFGLAPADQGPMVNQIFDPETVDLIFGAEPAVRDRLDVLHRNSNNAVANLAVIREIFDLQYRDRWLGAERLVFHRMTRLDALDDAGGDGLGLRLRDELTGEAQELAVDAAVFGTGYRVFDSAALLGEHAALLERDADGRAEVERDCRARLRAEGTAGLYLVGQAEHLHGISSALLSNVAVRAGEIADSLVARQLVGATGAALRREGSHV